MPPGTSTRQVIDASGVGFGTSGVRGLVGQLTDPACAAYVRAFLAVMSDGFGFRRVALGIDLRPSSPRIAAACAGAIRDAGFEVDYCGVLPTPALAWHAIRAGVPAVMVTGSHIPFDRNGLKFYRPDGEISKADELAMMQVELPLPAIAGDPRLPAVDPAALHAYADRSVAFFPAGLLAGLRIGLYEHSSAARDVFAVVLRDLGAEVISLGRADTFVPIDTEAVSIEDAERGRNWSVEHALDAIISTDGDGDRPLVADENGCWLRGDVVGLICARYLRLDAVAIPVSCTTAIESSGAFGRVVRTRIGSPHVIAAMQDLLAEGRSVGGFEANGGFLLGSSIEMDGRVLGALTTRDAILPALAVLAAARSTGKISGLAASLPGRYTSSDRVQDFTIATSSALIAHWTRQPQVLLAELGLGCDGLVLDLTDVLRMTLANGEIIHLRPSGNAPELRCYCEAGTPARARELVESGMRYLISVRG